MRSVRRGALWAGVASAFWAATLAVALAAPPREDAGAADAGPDADAALAIAPPSAEIESAVAAMRDELASLLAFLEGGVGPLRSRDLFRFDLVLDDAVIPRAELARHALDEARAAAAEVEIPDAARDAGADGGDAGAREPFDAWLLQAPPSDGVARLLKVRTLELRAHVLSLSRGRREGLLSAEQAALRAESTRRIRAETQREAERADDARLQALRAAQEANTDAERRLAEIRADAEATRGEQIRARAELEEQRQTEVARETSQSDVLAQMTGRAEHVAERSPEADALYDAIGNRLVSLRERGDALLSDLERGPRAPRPEAAAFPDTNVPDLVRERDRLRGTLEDLQREADALDAESKALTWSALRAVMATERHLNALHIELLQRVSEEKRRRLMGIGEEGFTQGGREIARVAFELRWLRVSGRQAARDMLDELRKPAAIARLSIELVAILALLWATVTLRRRRAAWLEAARETAARTIRSPALLRLVKQGTAVLDAIGGELITLIGVLLVRAVPQLDVEEGVVSVVYTLALWYAIYRLALTATHRALAWAAARDGAPLAPETGEKILRSVRIVGRSAFFFAVLLASSNAVVGRGYLHSQVVRAAWLIAIPIVAILVTRWRDDIAQAYLRVRPTGNLSRLVARSRTHRGGFFVAIAAFAVLFGSGVVSSLRRFVLGFEHSRKALAYMFRRRLEKQGERQTSVPEPLPPEQLRFYTEDPVEEDALLVDHFPGMAEFEAQLAAWRDGEAPRATLVVGRAGFGKTTWLAMAKRRCGDVPCDRLTVRARTTTPEGVLDFLGEAVGAPPEARDVDALARYLLRRGRRVILVDDAHLWFLRGSETLEGFRAFSDLVSRTEGEVLWCVSFAHYAWEFLRWIAQGETVFRSVVHLLPWSETGIGRLLRKRNVASGLSISYDDLLVEEPGGALDAKAAILTTARDYNRLVWDYAEGSPRVALHVWSRSLVPDGPRRARVRLFTNPNATALEELGESAKFVLAALTWHEGISTDEAASVLLLPRAICRDAFKRFSELGICEPDGDGNHRVSSRWWPLVIRYLRRKHLIDT